MDLDSLSIAVVGTSNVEESRIQYMRQIGVISSELEHVIPEQLFVRKNTVGEAVSAIKAISKAMLVGQRIYKISKSNFDLILPTINLSSFVLSEISAAINAGFEVVTHTDSVSVPGWTGAGYIIIDPLTGEGAYKIENGSNGSYLDDYDEISGEISLSLGLLGLVLIIPGFVSAALLPIFTVILAILAIFSTLMNLMIADLELRKNKCPEAISYLFYATTSAFVILPKVFQSALRSFALTIYSFLTKNTIQSSSSACGKYL